MYAIFVAKQDYNVLRQAKMVLSCSKIVHGGHSHPLAPPLATVTWVVFNLVVLSDNTVSEEEKSEPQYNGSQWECACIISIFWGDCRGNSKSYRNKRHTEQKNINICFKYKLYKKCNICGMNLEILDTSKVKSWQIQLLSWTFCGEIFKNDKT